MRSLIAGLLLLVVGVVQAQTMCNVASTVPCAWNEDCLTWSRPTTYSDGTALNAADISTYAVEASPVGADTWTQVGTVTAPVQGYKRAGLKHGDAFQYRVSAILKSGVRSVPSNVCNLTTSEPTPSPPVLQTTDTVAYEIRTNAQGVLAKRHVGYVPIGSACEAGNTRKVGTVTYTRVAMLKPDYVEQIDFIVSATKLTDAWARCA